jgi:hypothetical protein
MLKNSATLLHAKVSEHHIIFQKLFLVHLSLHTIVPKTSGFKNANRKMTLFSLTRTLTDVFHIVQFHATTNANRAPTYFSLLRNAFPPLFTTGSNPSGKQEATFKLPLFPSALPVALPSALPSALGSASPSALFFGGEVPEGGFCLGVTGNS